MCSGEYPDRQASAIRHTLFARGLVELGLIVDIWLLTPQTWEKLELSRSCGLSFTKLNGLLKGSRWRRAVYKLVTIIKAFIKLIGLAIEWEKGENIVIVMYCTEVVFLAPMLIVAKIFGLPVIHERTELPYAVAEKTRTGKISLYIYLRYILPLFDRVMVINNTLGGYISKYNRKINKLLTVVDVETFRPKERAAFTFPYVAYCGTMYGHKDGVDILVRAFSIVSQKFPEWRLVLVGDNSRTNELAPLIGLIEDMGMTDKVIFTGRVKRQDVPIILHSAKVLALAKPSNEQNSGNFPIKLGEYLATGVPVVVTDVGEISDFIQDGVTGYLCSPTEKCFAERLEYVIGNLSEAVEVGERGSRLAEQLFAYNRQARILFDTINEVMIDR